MKSISQQLRAGNCMISRSGSLQKSDVKPAQVDGGLGKGGIQCNSVKVKFSEYKNRDCSLKQYIFSHSLLVIISFNNQSYF